MKTKDAFALRGFFESLLRIDVEIKAAELKFRASAMDELDKEVYESTQEDLIAPVEDFIKPEKISVQSLKKLKPSEIARIVLLVEPRKKAVLARLATKRIRRHVRRIKRYQKSLLSNVLRAGLSVELQARADRARLLLLNYHQILKYLDAYIKLYTVKIDDIEKKYRDSLRKAFVTNLKKARLAKNLSCTDLACTLGVTVGTYSLYESGRRYPSMPTLSLLAKLLDVTIDSLFDTQIGI